MFKNKQRNKNKKQKNSCTYIHSWWGEQEREEELAKSFSEFLVGMGLAF